MFEILQLPFMQRAFLIAAMASVPFGLIGTFVVVRRIGYLAGAIAHCALGGICVGLFLQYLVAANALWSAIFDPMLVSLAVTVASALLIGFIRLRIREREDTIFNSIWAVVMSLGLLLLQLTPGNVNFANYLFGDILLITKQDVYLVSGLSLVVLCVVGLFFKRLEAVCFDEEFAKLRGMSTTFYFQLLLLLTAMTVVLLVRIVGIILVIAMLTLPAATAGRFTKRLFPMCLLATALCFVSSWLGLVIVSRWGNLPAGPTIVLVAAALYIITLCPIFSRRTSSGAW